MKRIYIILFFNLSMHNISSTTWSLLASAENLYKQQPTTEQEGKKESQEGLITKLVKTYAPIVYLDKNEEYFPYSVDEYLKHVTLKDSTGNIKLKTSQINPQILSSYTQKNTDLYLDPINSAIYKGFPPINNIINAPVYVNAIELPEQKRYIIQYWFFYAFNGPPDINDPNLAKALLKYAQKLLNINYLIDQSLITLIYRNPTIPQFIKEKIKKKSIHEADWEHIVVYIKQTDTPSQISATKINNSFYQIDKIFYAHHRSSENGIIANVKNVSFYHNTHPVVYSALMTHGSYPTEFNTMNYLLDKTGSKYKWHTWNNIKMITPGNPINENPWINFSGKWGKDRAPRTPSAQVTWITGPTSMIKQIKVHYGPLPGEKSRASEIFSLSIPQRFTHLRTEIIPEDLNVAFGINKYRKKFKDINLIDQVKNGSIIPKNILLPSQNLYISRIHKIPKNILLPYISSIHKDIRKPNIKSFDVIFEGIE